VRDAGVPYFVHLSTGNAYGAGEAPMRESDSLYPSIRAPYYLTSKVTGEVFVDHLSRKSLLRAAILRVASIYGPEMPSGGLVPSMVSQLRTGHRLSVHDGGRYHVDLVHVDDVVRAILTCLDLRAEGIFNIGSGNSTSTLELAEHLVAVAGLDRTALDVSGSTEGPRLGFPALDITCARDQLGYSPMNLQDGLLSMM
jgi:UDP-glucose 4-epimerase